MTPRERFNAAFAWLVLLLFMSGWGALIVAGLYYFNMMVWEAMQ